MQHMPWSRKCRLFYRAICKKGGWGALFILVIAVLYRYMFMEGSDGHVRNDYRDACLVLPDFSMDAIYIFEQIFRKYFFRRALVIDSPVSVKYEDPVSKSCG